MVLKQALFITVIMLFAGGCFGAEGTVTPLPRNDALVMAATETVVSFNQAGSAGATGPFIEIPEDLWADEIKVLEPRRVYWHNNNLALVLTETQTIEEGLYIGVPISSYLGESDATIQLTPQENGFYTFKKNR